MAETLKCDTPGQALSLPLSREDIQAGLALFHEDLKSTNGIYVNEKKVSWKSPLLNNDIMTKGKYTFIFKDIFKDKKSDYEDVRMPEMDATVQTKKKRFHSARIRL